MEDIRPEVHIDGDAPAGIIYTSGTTGTSKGAVITHNNFAANAVNLLACWKISADDRFLLALPLFHVHGLGNGLHCWLMSGCRMRLLERFEHKTAAAEFLDFRPTLFFGVPTIYVRLLALEPATAREIGGFMRLFVSGSAPLPAQVLEEFRELFGHTILERYGMSETMMNLSNPYAGERRAGTVGFPLPGISVRLLNPALEPVPYGETGEIYLRGPNVFAGYWRREEATRDAFVDGYFKTGDLATRSPDGYFTLTGRKSDLIISGGFNIYPREIEEFLQEQPEIAEAAVIGLPDRMRGEVPVAYVVAAGNFRCQRNRSSLPRETGFVQSAARLHRRRKAAAQRHGQDPETPLAEASVIRHRQRRRRFSVVMSPELGTPLDDHLAILGHRHGFHEGPVTPVPTSHQLPTTLRVRRSGPPCMIPPNSNSALLRFIASSTNHRFALPSSTSEIRAISASPGNGRLDLRFGRPHGGPVARTGAYFHHQREPWSRPSS